MAELDWKRRAAGERDDEEDPHEGQSFAKKVALPSAIDLLRKAKGNPSKKKDQRGLFGEKGGQK